MSQRHASRMQFAGLLVDLAGGPGGVNGILEEASLAKRVAEIGKRLAWPDAARYGVRTLRDDCGTG